MLIKDTQNINHFRVAGINYKKTDTSVRGLFAVNDEQYQYLLSIADQQGIKEFFILSTCNRTEIYGLASSASQLADFLCMATTGDVELFTDIAYLKSGEEAITHLFNVAAGLDSQILGDYEIQGQIKNAVKPAKIAGCIGTFTERLLNAVMQSSKAIKTNTALSGGTVSVSFAAVQYIKQEIKDVASKKIVLLGTGKIGRTTTRNITDYLQTRNVTLINRTLETAQALAAELGVKAAPIEELDQEIADADIILVSTNAPVPVILKEHLQHMGHKLVLDLSVPCNVEAAVASLSHITLVNVDTLSRIKDETLQNRRQEVPKALQIIEEHVADFNEWCNMRKHVPVLKEVKSKLHEIYIDPTLVNPGGNITRPEETIQVVINSLATKMRRNNAPGCHYIEAINDFIAYRHA